jgi:hypothetical protein
MMPDPDRHAATDRIAERIRQAERERLGRSVQRKARRSPLILIGSALPWLVRWLTG